MAYSSVSKRERVGIFGFLLGTISLLMHWYAPSAIIERLYGQGLFRFVRIAFDHTVSLLPVAMFYVLLLALIILVLRKFRQIIQAGARGWPSLLRSLLNMLNFFGWLVFAFYWLWGFNYDRVQLKERLSWENPQFAADDFRSECEEVLVRMTSLRLTHQSRIDSAKRDLRYDLLERTLREETSVIAQDLGYESSALIACRSLKPAGILLRFSTAGFYNPFSGECNIDAGLHPLQKPFVMAHEFFHGLGITGEGDCNFLAYVTCYNSSDPLARYSAELGYWRYLRRGFYQSDPEVYNTLTQALPLAVIEDLEGIDEAIRRYPDIAPKIRNAMYSAYLKSNKIQDGLANYGQMVQMVMQWKRHHHKTLSI